MKKTNEMTVKLLTHVIQMYHKKPYPNVVKNYCREPDIT